MPLLKDFLHHLHELMVEVSDSVRNDEVAYKSQVLFQAQKKNNSGAILSACAEAALHAFRNRPEKTIERYIEELGIWRLEVDDSVEREMLSQINLLLGAPKQVNLPPGLQHTPSTQPIQWPTNS